MYIFTMYLQIFTMFDYKHYLTATTLLGGGFTSYNYCYFIINVVEL